MKNNIIDKYEYSNIFILLFVYSLSYIVSVITKVDSTEFMAIDPKSIVTSINELTTYPFYNMNDSYHSKYYGWTYFALNFIVISMAKLIGFNNEYDINIIIRSVIFVIGFCLIASLYVISREFFSKLVSFFLVFYFMFDPVVSHYINLIHPESLGMTLQVMGCFLLVRFYKNKAQDNIVFYGAIILLSLSSLAKQPFFIVNLVIGLIYLKFLYEKLNYKHVINLFFHSVFIFVLCFFVIHPYAFIEYEKFFIAQSHLSSAHGSEDIHEVAIIWFNTYIRSLGSLLLVVHTAVLVLVFFSKRKNKYHFLSLILVSLISILFMYKARIFISLGYLFPLYLLIYFNVTYFFFKCCKFNSYFSRLSVFFVLIFLSANALSNFSNTIFKVRHDHNVEDLTTQKVIWDYVSQLQKNEKIAYSPNVAIPKAYKSIGCHAWQGCANFNELEKFTPDLIIYSPEYQHFESEEYTRYIKDEGFNLIYTASPSTNFKYECGKGLLVPKGGVFPFFNIKTVLTHISTCVDDYFLSDNQKEQLTLIGMKIYVYQR